MQTINPELVQRDTGPVINPSGIQWGDKPLSPQKPPSAAREAMDEVLDEDEKGLTAKDILTGKREPIETLAEIGLEEPVGVESLAAEEAAMGVEEQDLEGLAEEEVPEVVRESVEAKEMLPGPEQIDVAAVQWDDENEPAKTPPAKTPWHQKKISLPEGIDPKAWGKGVADIEASASRIKEGLVNPEAPFGALEVLGHLGTMAYGVPAMGFGHIVDLATGGKYNVAEKVSEHLIYQPQTESGEVIRDILFSPFSVAEKVGEKRADCLFDELVEKYGPEDIRTSLYPTIRKTLWDILGILTTGKAAHIPRAPKAKISKEFPKLDSTFAKDEILTRMAGEKTKGVQRPLETLAKKEAGLKGEIPIVGKRAQRFAEIETAITELGDKERLAEMKEPYEGPPVILEKQPKPEPEMRTVEEKAGETFLKKATEAVGGEWGVKERGIELQKDPRTGEHGLKITDRSIPESKKRIAESQVNALLKEGKTAEETARVFESFLRENQMLKGKEGLVEQLKERVRRVGEESEFGKGKRTVKDIVKDVNAVFGERGEIGKADLTLEQQAALTRLSGDIDVIRKNAERTAKTVERYLIDLKFDPKVAAVLSRKAEDLQKYARSINLEKQEVPEQYKQLETDIGLTKPKKDQTWDQTGELSADLLKDYKTSAAVLSKAKKGEALTAVEIDAVRQINVNAIDRLAEMAKTLPDEKFKTAFETYQKDVFEATSAASSEAGRALNIHKKTVSVNRMAKAFAKLKRSLNERELKEFKELNFENPVEVRQFIDRIGDPKFKDYALEYWYNSILSGPPTHLVNTISNTGWLAFQVPHRALTALIDLPYSKLSGKPRQRYMNEIVPMLAGYKTGFKRGRAGAVQMMKTGKLTDFETKWAQEMGRPLGAFERSPSKVLRKAAPYITIPTRALRAMDVWANSIGYDAHANVLARRASNAKGLKKGKARFEFEKKFIENLSEKDHQACMEQGKYGTFMCDPDPFTNWILGARRVPVVGPGSQFIVPFVNTISNLTKRGMEMTPGLGIVKEAVSRGMGRGQPTPEIIAKQIEGAVLALYIMHKCDIGEITGPLPKNKAERETFYRQGKKPWAIRIGGTIDKEGKRVDGTWLQYRRIEPFNTVIASVAIAKDAIKNAKDEDTKTQIFLRMASGIKDNLIDSSYLQGVQQIFDKYGRAKGAVQRWTASWVPYSSFWRSINRSYEVATEGSTKVRTGDDWLKAFSQVIPGLSGKMPAKLDIWGEKIELPGGMFRQWLPYKWSKETTDSVEKELERLRVYPGLPGRKITFRGEKIELPEDVYREYCLDFGRQAKKKLLGAINAPYYSTRTEDLQMKTLTKRLQRTRDIASKRVKMRLKSELQSPSVSPANASQERPTSREGTGKVLTSEGVSEKYEKACEVLQEDRFPLGIVKEWNRVEKRMRYLQKEMKKVGKDPRYSSSQRKKRVKKIEADITKEKRMFLDYLESTRKPKFIFK